METLLEEICFDCAFVVCFATGYMRFSLEKRHINEYIIIIVVIIIIIIIVEHSLSVSLFFSFFFLVWRIFRHVFGVIAFLLPFYLKSVHISDSRLILQITGRQHNSARYTKTITDLKYQIKKSYYQQYLKYQQQQQQKKEKKMSYYQQLLSHEC